MTQIFSPYRAGLQVSMVLVTELQWLVTDWLFRWARTDLGEAVRHRLS
jgi:hypothetical protein